MIVAMRTPIDGDQNLCNDARNAFRVKRVHRSENGLAMSQMGPGCVKTPRRSIAIRTSYSFKTGLGPSPASLFNFEVELKNIILVEFRVFEFSHSLGPSRRVCAGSKLGLVRCSPKATELLRRYEPTSDS